LLNHGLNKTSTALFVILAGGVYEGQKGGFAMYTYAQVESALAKVHQVDDGAITAFRGRINNLKRLGVVPTSGGRGKKISYNVFDVLALAFCLQLFEYGIDPSTISKLSARIGPEVIRAAKIGENSSEDVYIAFFPSFLTAQIHDGRQTKWGDLSFIIVPESETTAKKLREKMIPKVNLNGADRLFKHSAKRIAAINISELVRDIGQAFRAQSPENQKSNVG
jgi:hypothetical protein